MPAMKRMRDGGRGRLASSSETLQVDEGSVEEGGRISRYWHC